MLSRMWQRVLLILVLACVVDSDSYAQANSSTAPKQTMLERLRELDSKSDPSVQELFDRAVLHKELGESYALMATALALCVRDQAECYSYHDSSLGGAATYISVLASLQLGELGRAKETLANLSKLKNEAARPTALNQLLKVLGRTVAAQTPQGGQKLSVDLLAPRSAFDSIEAATQIYLSSQTIGPKDIPVLATGGRVGKVNLAPLIFRGELLQGLAGKEQRTLRNLVSINSDSLTTWIVESKMAETPARFADPAVVLLLSRSHFYLSSRDFQSATGGSTSPNSRDKAMRRWLEVCLATGDFATATDLLSQLSQNQSRSESLLPYRGWVAAMSGTNDVSRRAFDDAESELKRGLARDSVFRSFIAVLIRLPEEKSRGDRVVGAFSKLIQDRANRKLLLAANNRGERILQNDFMTIFEWHWALKNFPLSLETIFNFEKEWSGSLSLDDTFSRLTAIRVASAKSTDLRFDIRTDASQKWQRISEVLPLAKLIESAIWDYINCSALQR